MKRHDANDTLRNEGVDSVRQRSDAAKLYKPPSAADRNTPSPAGATRPAWLEAKPWWRDPADIPRRRWLFDRHYVRGAIGATIAGGGRGKTTLGCVEAVSMAVGRNLMTGERLPDGALRVVVWNGEEDQDELDRRVAAVCQRYCITEADLDGRLFMVSVRDAPMRLAVMDGGKVRIDDHVRAAMVEFITEHSIDVFMVDPLVSFHAVPENDNGAMDYLVKQGFGAIALETNSAGGLFHHPGKPRPGQAETTVEDGRGASAILWAVRSARVLNFMMPAEASDLGIAEDDRRRHIRIANGKANMAPLGQAKWMRIEPEQLSNGDEVACASSWRPQNALDGVTVEGMHKCRKLAQTGAFRADSRSRDWVGYMVAEVLGIAVTPDGAIDQQGMARIKKILKLWFKNQVFAIEKRKDDSRHEREFVTAGPWKPEADGAYDVMLDPEEYVMQ